MVQPPTIFVVEDERETREVVRHLVESVSLHVEEYTSANAFLADFDPSRPGCLILDLRLPGMSGLELQAQLIALRAPLPIIMVTGHADVATAVEAMRAGALDFVEKPFQGQRLLDRIHQAITVDAQRRQHAAERHRVESLRAALTPREQQVVDLLVDGHSPKEAARVLRISHKTVQIHRARAMEKLQVTGIAELVRQFSVAVPWPDGLRA